MPIGKRLVNDCHGKFGFLIGRIEESALAQAYSDGCEVVTAYVSDECDLARYAVSAARLAVEKIEGRPGNVGEGDVIDRACIDDPRKSAHLLQHRVDKSHTAIEVL